MESASELSCPRCALPLKQVTTGHGMLWACSNCGGRAVGVELLRRTFTPESIKPLWLHAIRGEGPRNGPCPSCHNPMIEVQLSDTAAVKVDVCRLCHFVWFDAHEVDTLVPRRPPPAPSQKARETIATLQVQQIGKEPVRGTDFHGAPPEEWWKQIARFCGMPI